MIINKINLYKTNSYKFILEKINITNILQHKIKLFLDYIKLLEKLKSKRGLENNSNS